MIKKTKTKLRNALLASIPLALINGCSGSSAPTQTKDVSAALKALSEYRELNQLTLKEAFKMPVILEIKHNEGAEPTAEVIIEVNDAGKPVTIAQKFIGADVDSVVDLKSKVEDLNNKKDTLNTKIGDVDTQLGELITQIALLTEGNTDHLLVAFKNIDQENHINFVAGLKTSADNIKTTTIGNELESAKADMNTSLEVLSTEISDIETKLRSLKTGEDKRDLGEASKIIGRLQEYLNLDIATRLSYIGKRKDGTGESDVTESDEVIELKNLKEERLSKLKEIEVEINKLK